MANAPQKATHAEGRWGGKRAEAIGKKLRLRENEYVYLPGTELAALEKIIDTEEQPFSDLLVSKRALSSHLFFIAVTAELASQQAILTRLRNHYGGTADLESEGTKETSLPEIVKKQAENVQSLQAQLDMKLLHVSEIGLTLKERRRLANTPEKLEEERLHTLAALENLEAKIAVSSAGRKFKNWRFKELAATIFGNLFGIRQIRNWYEARTIANIQSHTTFFKIPSWRLKQVLSGLYTPLIKLSESTQAIDEMVGAFTDSSVPLNSSIKSKEALLSFPNLKPEIPHSDLALELLSKHIEHGGTVRLRQISNMEGVFLDINSQRDKIETATHSTTRATFSSASREITLNVADPTLVAEWMAGREFVFEKYNINLAHEASHSAIAAAELLPSRFLQTVRTGPQEGRFAFSLRLINTFEGRLQMSEMISRVVGAPHRYLLFDSVVARAKHADNKRIIEDLNRSFEQVLSRPLLPETQIQAEPLINEIRKDSENPEPKVQLWKLIEKDLFSSLGKIALAKVQVAFYKAYNLRAAADETFAHRVNGTEINYDSYTNLDESLRSILETTILPRAEQYMRRPEVYRDFLTVLESAAEDSSAAEPEPGDHQDDQP